MSQSPFRLMWADPTLRMLCGATLLFGTFVSSIGIYQSLIAVTVFGLSDTGYAVVLLLSLIVSVGSSVGVGIVTDQRPSRKIMASAATGAVLAGALLVWGAAAPWAFVLAHILLLPLSGTLFGQIFAIARLVTAPLPRVERDSLLALLRALFAVPFVIVLPLWGYGFEHGLSLTVLYPFVALICAILLWLIARHWPADATAPWTEQKSGLNFRASLGEMLVPAVLGRVMLIGALHSGSALAGVLVALIFDEASGRGPADVGLFFAIFVAVEIVVTLNIGHFVRRLRRLYVIALGVFVYAVFLALLPLLAASPAVWLLVIPAGVGGALLYALAIGYLQDLLGQRAGAGSSLIALQRLSSDGLSAAIFAVGSWLSGYGLAAVLGAVVMSGAMVWILWLDRNRPLDA